MKPLKPATEILLSAAFVLTPEENWTQFTPARDAQGNPSTAWSYDAVSFCAVGAIDAARDALHADHGDAYRAKRAFGQAVGTVAWGEWNDDHTHAEVLDALYRAAALSEES